MTANALGHHFFTMACNNAWANDRLLAACAELRDGEFNAPTKSFFGSIAATANHLLTVDWFYVDALERTLDGEAPHASPGAFFDPECPHDGVAELAEAQRLVDRRLMALTRSLDGAQLQSEVHIRRRRGLSSDSVTGVLAHLFQHQIHHRGQIHALLSVADVAPPQLDEFFCRGDAPAREAWLHAQGLTEAALHMSVK